MGVNCCVRLNEGAGWKKVGKVACVLLGAKVHREPLGKDGWHLVVEGFGYGEYKATHTPEYIDIMVCGDADNPAARSIAASDGLPYRLWYGLENRSLYPKATAAKIALALAITKFFGGRITYNDSSGKKRTFLSPFDFKPETDKAFYAFETALEALKPLTVKDIKQCEKYAAY